MGAVGAQGLWVLWCVGLDSGGSGVAGTVNRRRGGGRGSRRSLQAIVDRRQAELDRLSLGKDAAQVNAGVRSLLLLEFRSGISIIGHLFRIPAKGSRQSSSTRSRFRTWQSSPTAPFR